MDRPKIVLGLGNPGARYDATRHNLGFRVVDLLAERAGAVCGTDEVLPGPAWTAEIGSAPTRIVLAKPRTYMNRSGLAAAALCSRYAADPGELLVVYDDADLELGRLHIRRSGRAAGHNGMRSLIQALGEEAVPRLRLGVRGSKREEQELADYVLAPFDPEELPVARELARRAADAVQAILDEGLTAAMNRYNAQPAPESGQSDRPNKEG